MFYHAVISFDSTLDCGGRVPGQVRCTAVRIYVVFLAASSHKIGLQQARNKDAFSRGKKK
jgi:hypothetical protein